MHQPGWFVYEQLVEPLHHLLHPVEGWAGVEPIDLLLVEGVAQADLFGRTVGMVQHSGQGLNKGNQLHSKEIFFKNEQIRKQNNSVLSSL